MEVVRLENRPEGAKFEDVRELVSGARGKTVYETGDIDAGIWSAGITIGLIHDIVSVSHPNPHMLSLAIQKLMFKSYRSSNLVLPTRNTAVVQGSLRQHRARCRKAHQPFEQPDCSEGQQLCWSSFQALNREWLLTCARFDGTNLEAALPGLLLIVPIYRALSRNTER